MTSCIDGLHLLGQVGVLVGLPIRPEGARPNNRPTKGSEWAEYNDAVVDWVRRCRCSVPPTILPLTDDQVLRAVAALQEMVRATQRFACCLQCQLPLNFIALFSMWCGMW